MFMTDAEKLKVIRNAKKSLIQQRNEWLKLAKKVSKEEKTKANAEKLSEYTEKAKRCEDGLKTCEENINKLFDSLIYVAKDQVDNWESHISRSYDRYAGIVCLVDEMVSMADVMKLHNDRKPIDEVFKTAVAGGVTNTLWGVDIFYKQKNKFNEDMVYYLATMTPSEIDKLQQFDKTGMSGMQIYEEAVGISNHIFEDLKTDDEMEDEEGKGGKQ